VIVNTVVIVRGVPGSADFDVTIVLAAYGAGSMAVAFLLPRLLERPCAAMAVLFSQSAAIQGCAMSSVTSGSGIQWLGS